MTMATVFAASAKKKKSLQPKAMTAKREDKSHREVKPSVFLARARL